MIELIHAVPDQPVHHARALVDLEGPDELAAAAEEVASKVTAVSLQAGSVLLMAPRIRAAGDRSLFGIGMRHRAKADALKAHEELETAIASFLRIARAHLNGG
ncbi:hypothetical protein ABZT26_25580 [Streptomyces sp. NPDC005395]|uniref:hypothetical protein n=1 Tax=Streptomyces sp. NPDC005395 TaxID=3157042 RepID=UPI0033B956C6